MKYGERIEQLLKIRGLKQYHLATGLKKDRVTISRWVNKSHLSTKEIEQVCKFFNISIPEFFIDDEEEAKKLNIPVEYLDTLRDFLKIPLSKRIKFLEAINNLIDLMIEEEKTKEE